MNKKESILITALFILFLILPHIGQLLNLKGEGELLENKRLSAFPPLNPGSVLSLSFGEKINDYVWDHLPLRTQMLRMDHWIDYHIFGDSPLPETVMRGKADWLFITNSVTKWPENQVRLLKQRINLFKNMAWTQEKTGRRIFAVLSPAKASIYPEFLPDFFRKPCEQRNRKFQKEIVRLARKTNIMILLWDAFHMEKNALLKRPPSGFTGERLRYVFRPRDRHFHWEAALLQAERIMNTIAPGKWQAGMFDTFFTGYSIGPSEMEKRFLKISLPEPYKQLRWNKLMKSFSIEQIKSLPDKKKNYLSFRTGGSETLKPLDTNLVVVHDSFMGHSKFFLYPFFKSASFIHIDSLRKDFSLIKVINRSDILIFQTVEDHFFRDVSVIKRVLKNMTRHKKMVGDTGFEPVTSTV